MGEVLLGRALLGAAAIAIGARPMRHYPGPAKMRRHTVRHQQRLSLTPRPTGGGPAPRVRMLLALWFVHQP